MSALSGPFLQRDAIDTVAAIRAGDLSPVEVVRATLEGIHALQETVNAFTVIFDDDALAAARAIERSIDRGDLVGPLQGVPFSVKDVMWVQGELATNGSIALRDFVPGEDATLVSRLRAAGAILVGKTNNPEFCYRGFTDNAVWGLTRNPWDLSRTPGGSSGGAAASVACGLTPIAVGSDGGGSIRIPASFCGVVGHKPTFGLIPQGPGFPGWKSLTANGPITRTVRDAALVLDVLAGPDTTDDLALPPLRKQYAAALDKVDPSRFRTAVSVDLGFASVDPGVRAAFMRAVGTLESAGWNLEEAQPPATDPNHLEVLLGLCESYASDGHLLERSPGVLDATTREALEAAAGYSATDYLRAVRERADYTRSWHEFFEAFDIVLTPATQVTAFATGIPTPLEVDGHAVDPTLDRWCALSFPANLAQLPAASVPCGFDENHLPVGLQIMASRFSDDRVLQAAQAWEHLSPWDDAVPPLLRAS